MPTISELAAVIAPILELDHQYVTRVSANDVEQIALVRAAGRKAGALLGYKVRTSQTDPDLDHDTQVVVTISVVESTPQDDERIWNRAMLLAREHFEGL